MIYVPNRLMPTSGFAAVPVPAKSEEFHAVGGCCPSARDKCIHPYTKARGKTFRQVINTSFIHTFIHCLQKINLFPPITY
jgi:hypothetical protein